MDDSNFLAYVNSIIYHKIGSIERAPRACGLLLRALTRFVTGLNTPFVCGEGERGKAGFKPKYNQNLKYF